MSIDDRLDRLEQRLAVLETLVRQLAAAGVRGTAAATPAAPAPRVAPPPAPPPPAPPASPAPRAAPAPGAAFSGGDFPGERWVGQRVFLGIGVVALLLAAGYLLKLSFDRGWISPVMRCLGGVVAGLAVGAIGWRLEPRYRTYGAALVGTGAGIIYLSIWAAGRLYEVLPPSPGIVGLALVSVALAMIAYAIDVEALGIAAALGAFFAPVLLGGERANPDLLLLYLGSMAAGLGMVAARRRWRTAALTVAASYFGVAMAGAADHANAWAVLLYGVVGGTAGLIVGLRERWWETRFLTFSGGWALLWAAGRRIDHPWAVLAAGLVLSGPILARGFRSPRVFPLHPGPRGAGTGWSVGEALYFFATPVLLGWALHRLDPARFDVSPWLVPLAVAVPYLLAGYLRPRPAFALVGAAAAGVAADHRWEGPALVWALLLLALLWCALDLRLRRTDGRWYGLLTLGAALEQLVDTAAGSRLASDAAFVGAWALALWGTIAVTVGLAAGLWPVDERRDETRLVRAGLWILAGVMALFGVTGELRRYFELQSLDVQTANLASGLAVSAWWLVFAAALVVLGFRLPRQEARIAGLAVAGLAVGKVVFFDLSSLDALYRIGSVFLLALVALSLAYLYYRHDRGERT